jgi:hypothetical protein
MLWYETARSQRRRRCLLVVCGGEVRCRLLLHYSHKIHFEFFTYVHASQPSTSMVVVQQGRVGTHISIVHILSASTRFALLPYLQTITQHNKQNKKHWDPKSHSKLTGPRWYFLVRHTRTMLQVGALPHGKNGNFSESRYVQIWWKD